MKLISIANWRGGCGKTTTALALAYGLHGMGKRVLLIDLDPQCNASFSCGIDLTDLPATLYDVFRNESDIKDAIQQVEICLDIITGGLALSNADRTFTDIGRERLLAEALDPVKDEYDYGIIDTAPSVSLPTIMALTASDYLVIPVTTDAFSVQGLVQLRGLIQRVQKYTNQSLKVCGLLLTMYNKRITLAQALETSIQNIADSMGTKIFTTRIRRAQAISDQMALQRSIFSQKSKAADDYKDFITELLAITEGRK